MATQIRTEDGKVLIEKMEITPQPGEIVLHDSKEWVASNDPSRIEPVDRGMGRTEYLRVVKVRPKSAAQTQSRGGRGPVVEG